MSKEKNEPGESARCSKRIENSDRPRVSMNKMHSAHRVHIWMDVYNAVNESEKVVENGESEKWILTEQRCLLRVEQWMNEAVWKES